MAAFLTVSLKKVVTRAQIFLATTTLEEQGLNHIHQCVKTVRNVHGLS